LLKEITTSTNQLDFDMDYLTYDQRSQLGLTESEQTQVEAANQTNKPTYLVNSLSRPNEFIFYDPTTSFFHVYRGNNITQLSTFISSYALNERLAAETRVANEILAQITGNVAINMPMESIKTKVSSNLESSSYSYFISALPTVSKDIDNIQSPILDIKDKSVEPFLNYTVNNLYSADTQTHLVAQALDAYETLIGKGYTHEEATILLQSARLANWRSLARRTPALNTTTGTSKLSIFDTIIKFFTPKSVEPITNIYDELDIDYSQPIIITSGLNGKFTTQSVTLSMSEELKDTLDDIQNTLLKQSKTTDIVNLSIRFTDSLGLSETRDYSVIPKVQPLTFSLPTDIKYPQTISLTGIDNRPSSQTVNDANELNLAIDAAFKAKPNSPTIVIKYLSQDEKSRKSQTYSRPSNKTSTSSNKSAIPSSQTTPIVKTAKQAALDALMGRTVGISAPDITEIFTNFGRTFSNLFHRPTSSQNTAYNNLPTIPDKYLHPKKVNILQSEEFYNIEQIQKNLGIKLNSILKSDLIKLLENLPSDANIYRGGEYGSRNQDWTLNFNVAIGFVENSYGANKRDYPVLQIIKVKDLLEVLEKYNPEEKASMFLSNAGGLTNFKIITFDQDMVNILNTIPVQEYRPQTNTNSSPNQSPSLPARISTWIKAHLPSEQDKSVFHYLDYSSIPHKESPRRIPSSPPSKPSPSPSPPTEMSLIYSIKPLLL
jgi:hypothetical protein